MQTKKKLTSIEGFRFLGVIAVIAIHTRPFANLISDSPSIYNYLYYGINALLQFAVPLFFMVSAYFFSLSLKKGSPVFKQFKSSSKRLLTPFLFWTLFFACMPHKWLGDTLRFGLWEGLILNAGQTFQTTLKLAAEDPLYFIFQSSSIHLWFLMALWVGLLILTLTKALKVDFFLLPLLGLGLYIIGMLSRAYNDSPLGLSLDFDTRNGPFLSTLFVFWGYFVAQKSINISKTVSVLLILGGMIMQYIEGAWLYQNFGTEPAHVYVLGTVPFAVGIFHYALSKPQLFENSILSKLGKYTLGIYLAHPIFYFGLLGLRDRLPALLWELTFTPLVLIASLILVLVLSRIKIMQKVIS